MDIGGGCIDVEEVDNSLANGFTKPTFLTGDAQDYAANVLLVASSCTSTVRNVGWIENELFCVGVMVFGGFDNGGTRIGRFGMVFWNAAAGQRGAGEDHSVAYGLDSSKLDEFMQSTRKVGLKPNSGEKLPPVGV